MLSNHLPVHSGDQSEQKECQITDMGITVKKEMLKSVIRQSCNSYTSFFEWFNSERMLQFAAGILFPIAPRVQFRFKPGSNQVQILLMKPISVS